MERRSILIYYHCGANTGYAIETLEKVFFEVAIRFTQDIDQIHIGYSHFKSGPPKYLPKGFSRITQIKPFDVESHSSVFDYIKKNRINVVFGFDQGVSAPIYRVMRRAGVKLFVSYWGAPMSSINHGLKLALKRVEVFIRQNKPDHYIFESKAMAETAVFGRGIPAKNVSVIPLGVNTDQYKPNALFKEYAHDVFSIPKDRKIIYYSGHMERRKGVDVIIHAANELICKLCRSDIHFLILGNKNQEEVDFDSLYKNRKSANHITFGGYRSDVSSILPSCHLGVIASTGWDSFTMSSVEMAAAGLPLIVSNLQGLKEVVEPQKTGYLFEPGDHIELSQLIERVLDDSEEYRKMSNFARRRILDEFSMESQIIRLSNLLEELYLSKFGQKPGPAIYKN